MITHCQNKQIFPARESLGCTAVVSHSACRLHPDELDGRLRGGRSEDIYRAREDIFICVFFTALALYRVGAVCTHGFSVCNCVYTWLHGIVCGCVCDSARTLGTVDRLQYCYSTRYCTASGLYCFLPPSEGRRGREFAARTLHGP